MLGFVPHHLKTKNTYKHAVKNLPLVIRYYPDPYKTPKMCNRAILKTGGTLMSVPDCY